MHVRISRHARNNIRLYGMTSADVQLVLEAPDRTEQEGRYQVAYRHFLRRFGDFPVKVVYAEEQELVVVSVYPLKRSYRR